MELSVVDNGVVQKPKTGRDKVGNDHINLKKEVKDCGSKLGLVSLCSAPGPQAVQPHQQRHKATKPNAEARASYKQNILNNVEPVTNLSNDHAWESTQPQSGRQG